MHLLGAVDDFQIVFHVFSFEFLQLGIFFCSSNSALLLVFLRNLRHSPMTIPFFTPGGWQELPCTYWKVKGIIIIEQQKGYRVEISTWKRVKG